MKIGVITDWVAVGIGIIMLALLNTLFNFVKYIPGVSLLFVIGITAKFIASFILNMEYVLKEGLYGKGFLNSC